MSTRPSRKIASDFSAAERQLLELTLKLRDAEIHGNTTEIEALERQIREGFYTGTFWFDPKQRAESREPLLLCLSFPRSGATRFIYDLKVSTGGDVFFAVRNSSNPLTFNKRWQPRQYPRTRIVKDHRPLKIYLCDDGYLLVRDGRDCMASLAWMTRARGLHSFWRPEELADFIRWTTSGHALGSWASHTKQLLSLREGGNKTVVRYEDYKSESTIDQVVKSDEDTRRAWGIVEDDFAGSMFEAWQKSRGRSNWRATLDRAAGRAFHETGATDLLIELGYEKDTDWWKQL